MLSNFPSPYLNRLLYGTIVRAVIRKSYSMHCLLSFYVACKMRNVWRRRATGSIRYQAITLTFQMILATITRKIIYMISTFPHNTHLRIFFLSKSRIPESFLSSVYKYHLQHTNDYQDWFSVNTLYLETTNAFERSYVVSALSLTRLTWLLDLYLLF